MAAQGTVGTGYTGVEVRGKSTRVVFEHKKVRHRHAPGLDPAKAKLKRAASVRATALFALKTGKIQIPSPQRNITRSSTIGACTRLMRPPSPSPSTRGPRPGELCAVAIEDAAPDPSKLKIRRAITKSLTFKLPKNNKERRIMLYPPAKEALKVLIADAEKRDPVDVEVWLNRHESRAGHVRVPLSPKTEARKNVVNDCYVPSDLNTKWGNLIRRVEFRPRPPYQIDAAHLCLPESDHP